MNSVKFYLKSLQKVSMAYVINKGISLHFLESGVIPFSLFQYIFLEKENESHLVTLCTLLRDVYI